MTDPSPAAVRPQSYFFTVRLEDRSSDLLVREIDLLRLAVRLCRKQQPFIIDAAVVLPSMVHMIWTLPPGDADFAGRWRTIKTTFARHLPDATRASASRLWQRRFWEQPIADASDMAMYRHFIATAPVEQGLVRRARDWPYSSAVRQARAA